MVSVTIVGVGRVGGALALSLPSSKYKIVQLIFRGGTIADEFVSRLPTRPDVARFDSIGEIATDIVFITTQDGRVEETAKFLTRKIRGNPVVFHTSGSYPSSILDMLRTEGCSTGSLHPLVSISSPEFGPERFRGAYFCIEGMPASVEMGSAIVSDLGGNSFSIDTRFKTLYHAAAVTACGHLVALFDAAVEMMTKCGIAAADAKTILMPLVLSTVKNLSVQSTPEALTGTFARADIDTLTRHLTTLNANVSDDLLEIYLLLGERSLELAARQGVSAERIDTMRTKVSIAKSKLKW